MSANGILPSSPLQSRYPQYIRERMLGPENYSSGRLPPRGSSQLASADSANSSGGSIWGRFVAWLGLSTEPTKQFSDRLAQLESEVLQTRAEIGFLKKKIVTLEATLGNFTTYSQPIELNGGAIIEVPQSNVVDGVSQSPPLTHFSSANFSKFCVDFCGLKTEVHALKEVTSPLNQGLQHPALLLDRKNEEKASTSSALSIPLIFEPIDVPSIATPPQGVTVPGGEGQQREQEVPSAEAAKALVRRRRTIDGSISNINDLQNAIRLLKKVEQPSAVSSSQINEVPVEGSPKREQQSPAQNSTRPNDAVQVEQEVSAKTTKELARRRRTIDGSISNINDLQNAIRLLKKVEQPSAVSSSQINAVPVEGSPKREQQSPAQNSTRPNDAAQVEQEFPSAKAAKELARRRRTIDGIVSSAAELKDTRAPLIKTVQPSIVSTLQINEAPTEASPKRGLASVPQNTMRTDDAVQVEQRDPSVEVAQKSTGLRNKVKDFARHFESTNSQQPPTHVEIRGIESPLQNVQPTNGSKRLSLDAQKAASSTPIVDENPCTLAEMLNANKPSQDDNVSNKTGAQSVQDESATSQPLRFLTAELLATGKAKLRKENKNPYIDL